MGYRHIHLNIKGGIENAEDLIGCIKVDGKTLNTVSEIRAFLQSQLDMGRKVLPIGDCDNFDYQTGCKGHSDSSDNNTEPKNKIKYNYVDSKIIKAFENAWYALSKSYTECPDETVRTTMNTIGKIIGKIKYEYEKNFKATEISTDDWLDYIFQDNPKGLKNIKEKLNTDERKTTMVDLHDAIEEISKGKISFQYNSEYCLTTEGEVVIFLEELENIHQTLKNIDFNVLLNNLDQQYQHKKDIKVALLKEKIESEEREAEAYYKGAHDILKLIREHLK